MITKLDIQEIPSNNCKILRLVDNSVYNPDITVENGILEITPPGYDCPVLFTTTPEFNTGFNSSALKIIKSLSNTEIINLPDGVYKIKYSIRPNTILFVEYDLFRNCQQMTRYIKAVCDLFSKKCDISRREFEEKRRNLIWIKELIDAAKYKVEECCDSKQGLELYNEANLLLSDINKSCC